MQKITNKSYRKFIDTGEIEPVTEEELNSALENVKGRYKHEGRALLIMLYYTGARPVEVLQIRAKDVTKAGSYVLIRVVGAKGGLTRTIRLQYRRPLVKELYKYSNRVYPDMYLFFNFKGSYKRTVTTRKGTKERTDTTAKIYYHFKKWFEGVREGSLNPYFLRHNRFSKLMMKGATAEEIRVLKGAKSINSVMPYIHLSSDTSKKLAKKIE